MHCNVLVVTSVNNATYNCTQITWLDREEKFTWIPKSEAPQQLIDEYEGGMESEEMILQDSRYGVVTRTIMTRSMAKAKAVVPEKCTPLPESNGYVCGSNQK